MAAAAEVALALPQEESREFAEIAHGEPPPPPLLPPIIIDDDALPLDAVLSPGCFFGFLVRGPVNEPKVQIDKNGANQTL